MRKSERDGKGERRAHGGERKSAQDKRVVVVVVMVVKEQRVHTALSVGVFYKMRGECIG